MFGTDGGLGRMRSRRARSVAGSLVVRRRVLRRIDKCQFRAHRVDWPSSLRLDVGEFSGVFGMRMSAANWPRPHADRGP